MSAPKRESEPLEEIRAPFVIVEVDGCARPVKVIRPGDLIELSPADRAILEAAHDAMLAKCTSSV